MLIPEHATVKPFEKAEIGSLLVGRFTNKGPNFFGVRTELKTSTGDPSPYMVIMNSWVDEQPRPFLCNPVYDSTAVLDLGNDWAVDVLIDEDLPTLGPSPNSVLFRSGAEFFLHLRNREGFLNLDKGVLVETIDMKNLVSWSEFAICLTQPGVDEPGAEIFRWPRESAIDQSSSRADLEEPGIG